MRRQRRFVSAGPWIISTISLFVALTSVAGALPGTNTVDSGDIKPEAVHAADITRGAVHGPQIADDAVGSSQIADGALTPADIGYKSIVHYNIADGAVTGYKMGDIFLKVGFNGVVPLSPQGATAAQSCPNGTRLISGGALTTGNSGQISASYPDPQSASSGPDLATKLDPTRWIAEAAPTNQGGYLQAFALCLDG